MQRVPDAFQKRDLACEVTGMRGKVHEIFLWNVKCVVGEKQKTIKKKKKKKMILLNDTCELG